MMSYPANESFFLFGPRGTGKSSWLKEEFAEALYVDLLDDETYTSLLAYPRRLEEWIVESNKKRVVIDEVQKLPKLLDEVHRLIESRKLLFVLSGSSARKLKRTDVNLLAGRAETLFMYPLTVRELEADFDLKHSLQFGQLPLAYTRRNPKAFLKSYITTYLKEEIQQEGLTRNVGAFSRFLEAASFSQGSILNMAEVGRESAVERKTVEEYFTILEDLLLAVRIPVFTKRARREIIVHPKFYFFDAGVYRAIRPRGPLDAPEEIDGTALETLFFQECRALNDYLDLEYKIYYWRTRAQLEVDFVLYGERGLHAFEIKRTARPRGADLAALREFLADYPEAKAYCLHGGRRDYSEGGVQLIPFEKGLKTLPDLIG